MQSQRAVRIAQRPHWAGERNGWAEGVNVHRVLGQLRNHARVVKGAAGAPHHSMSVAREIVREAEARRPIAIIGPDSAAWKAGITRECQTRRGVGVDLRAFAGAERLRAEDLEFSV